jgi:hypothetical protein
MVDYLLVKMINQMIHYFVNQRDQPIHNEHFNINLSKMTNGFFESCLDGIFPN